MQVYRESLSKFFADADSDPICGLSEPAVIKNAEKFGKNVITKSREKSVAKRFFEALSEPMMLILLFAFVITFGINLGKAISGNDANFYECVGIAIAILISTVLTVVMEGRSQRAFAILNKLGDDGAVRVIRSGSERIIPKTDVVVGDILLLEAGDKVPADVRLISANELTADESMLTGESKPVKKYADRIPKEGAGIADIKNALFSGTFISSGSAKTIVVAVGDNAETGKLAEDVLRERTVSAPLEEKLSRLGKLVTVCGAVAAAFVFLLSLVRLILLDEVTFFNVENVFVEAIVLIVAAVPEGLPTTVAISLTLNVVKLARSNALIKKLVATETVGCVSVICSDKTGTLTQNKMSVDGFFVGGAFIGENKLKDEYVAVNCAVNSSAVIVDGKADGSATEIALISALKESGTNYEDVRSKVKTLEVSPFSSFKKYMSTTVLYKGERLIFVKGAPEVVLKMTGKDARAVPKEITACQERGKRVLAFAHGKGDDYVFDGYAIISDKLRKDVKKSVKECLSAGIKIKILTGDNIETARSIAAELELPTKEKNVVSADIVESLSEEELINALSDITVIARSTPRTKLRVVKTLQKMGEVVAVTGDGVNDAPAIKHADIGIAMGSGSEITKEASDVVLLDDSFSTILTAISFGRNIYSNFQRFITFQLNVNLASMSIIIVYLLLGFASPFTSTCLLWLNVIMDGPLALSLGLEQRPLRLEGTSPVKRSDNILSAKIMMRIAMHSFYMCFIVALQKLTNFLGVPVAEEDTVVITMFVFFQLFNAINCREVHRESALKRIFTNKLFCVMLAVTYFLHIAIVQFLPHFFGTVPIPFALWLKITAVCSTVLIFSEAYKAIYRAIKRARKTEMAKFAVIKKSPVT